MTKEWSSGLFECFFDPSLCVQTLLCPCVTYGKISRTVENKELIGHGQFAMPCFAFCLGMLCGCEPCIVCNLRHIVMANKNIKRNDICEQQKCPQMCEQFCCSWLCFYCVLGQMHAEYNLSSITYANVYTAPPMFANTMIINTRY